MVRDRSRAVLCIRSLLGLQDTWGRAVMEDGFLLAGTAKNLSKMADGELYRLNVFKVTV